MPRPIMLGPKPHGPIMPGPTGHRLAPQHPPHGPLGGCVGDCCENAERPPVIARIAPTMIALRIFPPPLAVLAYHGRELQVEDMPVLTADRGGKSKRQADVRALTDLIRT